MGLRDCEFIKRHFIFNPYDKIMRSRENCALLNVFIVHAVGKRKFPFNKLHKRTVGLSDECACMIIIMLMTVLSC